MPKNAYGYAKKLRQRMTNAEEILWQALRNRKLAGLKFKRQVPFGIFVADFYCASQKLILEIDGGIHELRKEYDAYRTEQLAAKGYRILRISNEKVEKKLKETLEIIRDAISQ